MNKDRKIDHANRGHAKFSPSGIKPLAMCSGYEGKSGNSKPAVMGTFVHECLETLDANYEGEEIKGITLKDIMSRLDKLKDTNDDIDFDFDMNDIELMNEMFSKIKRMEKKHLKKVFKKSKKTIGEDLFEIQLTMDLGKNDTWGTCDRLTMSECGTYGLMADYKTGLSKIDSPRDNHQAITYTIGAFQKFPKLEILDFAFYIPQLYDKPLKGRFTRDEIEGLCSDIDLIIEEAKKTRAFWDKDKHPPKKRLSTNDYCRFCKHITKCNKCVDEVMDIFGITCDAEEEAEALSSRITPEVLMKLHKHPDIAEELWIVAKRIGDWSDVMKKEVVSLAVDGYKFDKLALRKRSGAKRVTDKDKLITMMKTEFGVSIADLIKLSSIPFGKASSLVPKNKLKIFTEEAIENGAVSQGKDSYFLQQKK